MKNKKFISAILLLSGEGKRFQSDIPKQFHLLGGKEIYRYALEKFLQSSYIDEIILVCPFSKVDELKEKHPDPKIIITAGGKTRQESSYKGLLACNTSCDIAMIHDAARPFLSERIIEDSLQAMQSYKAVDTYIPSTDTVILSTDKKEISKIPIREHLLRGQTPQTFDYKTILFAHQYAMQNKITNVTDDCSLADMIGEKIALVPGDEQNIKVTTYLDFALAEHLLRKKSSSTSSTESLQGKKYAVIGGSGYIGAALIKKLHALGATTYSLSRRATEYPCDLQDSTSIQSAFDKLFQKEGEIDGLINAAGMLYLKPFKELSLSEIESLLKTNFLGATLCCKYAKIKENGHIIKISSSSFFKGRKNYGLYSASKAALVNFTQSLAEEWEKMHIHAVIPQRIDSPMREKIFQNDQKETLLSAEAVVKAIISLLQDRSTTGSVIEVKKL